MNKINKIFEAFELAKQQYKEVLWKRRIFDKIAWNEKLVWLYGLRWVWKTTILFQKLNETKNSIYLSMDWGFLKEESLYELIKEIYKTYKIENFFVDEIHFCETWREDLKNVYDLLPVKVYFSGSNQIWIYEKWADLSRRAIFYYVPIFSLREFLNLKFGYDLEVLEFKDIFMPASYTSYLSKVSLNHLKEYLRFWQFGFYYENPDTYEFKLNQVVKKMIYEDGIDFMKIEKISDLEKLLYFIANTVQNKLSYTALAKKLQVHPKTIQNYLIFLEKIGIIKNIPKYGTISDSLRKEVKPYFMATNFVYVFCVDCFSDAIIWKLRENFFVSSIKNFNLNVDMFFKTTTDFVIKFQNKEYEFEIWWKSKTRKDVFVVKDDILLWDENTIPLWVFWMLW